MSTDDQFPFDEHRTCLTLTRLSEDNLPKDGSLGRVRRLRKDVDRILGGGAWNAMALGISRKGLYLKRQRLGL
jgi:hypothetical protein